MFLYKRKDSPNWYIGGIVEGGKKRCRVLHKFLNLSFPVQDKQTAEILFANLRIKEVRQELGIEQVDSVPVDQFYLEYFRFCDRNKTENTVKADKLRLNKWLQFLKDRKIITVSQITKHLLSNFLEVQSKHNKNSTLNRYISIIRSSLEQAFKEGRLEKDPLKDYPFKSISPYIRPTRISFRDAKKLLSIEDKLFLVYLKTLYYTMMRRTEALNLTWEDINVREKVVVLKKTKTKKPRTIPIKKKLWRILKELPRNDGKLFPWAPHSITTKFRRIKEKHRIKTVNGLHHLRKLGATARIAKGANPKAIQQALGHSTSKMTMDVYILEMNTEEIREALEK